MRKKESPSLESQVFQAFRNFTPFHSIIHYYVDLACFIIPQDQPGNWWVINRRKRPVSIYEFEVLHRGFKAREKYFQQCFKKALAKRAAVCGEHLGFKDLVVPLFGKGQHLGYLMAGAFSDREITAGVLKDCWKKLTGLEASAVLPEFREFTRVLLEMPVLNGSLLESYQEALELFARLLGGAEDMGTIGRRLTHLLENVFSKHFSHSYWIDWALGRLTNESAPAWSREIEKWEWIHREIGITRLPTTVLAVIPRRSLQQVPDWTEEMLRIYRFQRRLFRFAQTLPQAVGGKLENYGGVLVVSADPAKPRLMRRKQIEDIAWEVHRFAVKELQGPALVGIGESVSPGEPLKEGYRQALLALHLGLQSGKEISFYAAAHEPKESDGMLKTDHLLQDLSRHFREASFSDMEVVRDRFLEQVLHLSIQNTGEIRLHLQYAILRLAKVMGDRLGLGEVQMDELSKSTISLLGASATAQEMILSFKEALAKFVELSEKRKNFQSSSSMEKIRGHINDHFNEALSISTLAKMAGVSVPTFSRHFQKFSGMGMKTYLQSRRLDEAKRLLKAGSLPIFQISKDCGFKSNAYFVDLFRKKEGLTPQKYRQKFQRL